MAEAHRDPGFETVELRELRDPKQLGRILHEDPEHSSMLSPKSHLKAWLKFADDEGLRDEALAGARTLDHRTDDAVEMLIDKYDVSAPWTVLKYLPKLDLQTTEPLCRAALAQVRGDLMKAARPQSDDPRPDDELLSRLGAYAPLTALQWLAGHGCNADVELADADDLIHAYQDLLERAAMLASLAQLRRKL